MNNDLNQKRMGRGMLTIFWLLVLGGLATLFGNWEERQYNPNQNLSGRTDGDERILELERNRFGHYVVSGKINNKPVVFMLDTGATNVAVPEAVAQKLGLRRGRAHQVITANGVARAYHTEIASLHLGPIKLNNVKASITPGMTGNEILLGMSALKQLDFSQSGNILTLTQYSQPSS